MPVSPDRRIGNFNPRKDPTIIKTILLPIIVLPVSGAILAGCSKQEREAMVGKTRDAYAESKAAAVQAGRDLKSYAFERRAELGAQASGLRASCSDVQASASRKAALHELEDSEAAFQAKLAAIGNATSDYPGVRTRQRHCCVRPPAGLPREGPRRELTGSG